MADTPRKTLRLPAKIGGDATPPDPGRRPLRGGVSGAPRSHAAPAASAAPKPRAPLQQKPRGTPSRAPVIAKGAAPVRAKPTPGPASPAERAVSTGVRISKLMAERGLCSRRDADSYIERGWVFVDGERVTELGTRAPATVLIKLDKGARAAQERQVTILLHKPVGYVSGQPEPGFTPAVTLVLPENQYRTADTPLFQASCLRGLAPAGRLDIDSTGLLVLTQDGRVARRLIGENSTIEKEYLVRVEGRLAANGLALLNHGLSLDDRKLKPAQVEWLNDDQLRFVLIEGRKRQIRRMCELVGLRAVGLKRVRIGQVKLGDLPLGQWRFLRADESF
jgi:23S rRNA pseudouridine2604 synthase